MISKNKVLDETIDSEKHLLDRIGEFFIAMDERFKIDIFDFFCSVLPGERKLISGSSLFKFLNPSSGNNWKPNDLDIWIHDKGNVKKFLHSLPAKYGEYTRAINEPHADYEYGNAIYFHNQYINTSK